MTLTSGTDAVKHLGDYLESVLHAPVQFVGRAPGASHDGWIFRRDDDPRVQVVVRVEPHAGPFLTYDGNREAALLRELSARGLPVPEVLAISRFEPDGARFLVLNWIDGTVLNQQRAGGSSPEERAVLAGELTRTLARLHRVPWTELCGPDRPFPYGQDGSLTRYLREFDIMLSELQVVNSLVLDFVRVWLQRRTRERPPSLSLVHGDFRLGNLVWQGTRIAGVLDWETARVGDPLFDLAWLCMGATRGDDIVMGLVTRDELVDLYARAAGREVTPRELTFWQVVAAFVRGCTEARLLDLALTSQPAAERDARDLSWEFGSYRTDEELLTLIDFYERGR